MSMFTSDIIVGNTVAIPVDGSGVTQPVSGTFWQATQPVSGTFWQATQPISGSVSVTGSVAVTGTFWQATQPVSGSVSVSNFPATQAVTGTFWQAIQPVSGTVTTTPVVSNTSTVNQVTSTGANQTILAANSNRKKAILTFETGIWSVKFGATATATSLTYKVSSNNTTIEVDTWTGIIDAICTTAGKLVDVTELV